MVKRALLWFTSIGLSIGAGLVLDAHFEVHWPLACRLLGVALAIPSFYLLRISGRTLKRLGEQREWGVTTKLVTTGIYRCTRHPHHLGIGLFVTSISLIAGLFPFLLTTPVIWGEILWFLFKIEEPELYEKFGEEYRDYSRQTPMLLPRPSCLLGGKGREEQG